VIVAMVVDSVTKTSHQMDCLQEDLIRIDQRQNLEQIQKLVFEMGSVSPNGSGLSANDTVSLEQLEKVWDTDTMQLLLSGINLPHGSSPEELIQLLDTNADGEMQRDEFSASIFRLVEGDEFQHRCLLKMSVTQIKYSIDKLRKDLTQQSTDLRHEMKRGFAQHTNDLREEMQRGFAQIAQMKTDGHALSRPGKLAPDAKAKLPGALDESHDNHNASSVKDIAVQDATPTGKKADGFVEVSAHLQPTILAPNCTRPLAACGACGGPARLPCWFHPLADVQLKAAESKIASLASDAVERYLTRIVSIVAELQDDRVDDGG